jgi:hypothetical protein
LFWRNAFGTFIIKGFYFVVFSLYAFIAGGKLGFKVFLEKQYYAFLNSTFGNRIATIPKIWKEPKMNTWLTSECCSFR